MSNSGNSLTRGFWLGFCACAGLGALFAAMNAPHTPVLDVFIVTAGSIALLLAAVALVAGPREHRDLRHRVRHSLGLTLFILFAGTFVFAPSLPANVAATLLSR